MSGTVGRSYMAQYRDVIKELFSRGSTESTDKMGPAAMLEELTLLYPGFYSLPGENEIRSEISKLFASRKRAAAAVGGHSTRPRMPAEYAASLAELFDAEPSLVAREALDKLKALYAIDGKYPEAFPKDEQVKNKWNVLKSARNKNSRVAKI